MTDVPSSALRVWAKAVDDLMITVLLIPAFGFSAFYLFSGEPIWISWPFVIYLLLVPLLYEGLSLWYFGTTFGKWLFFLKVVDARNPGVSLRPGQTFTRALAGRLTLFFSYAVQALALFRYDRTHLADWLGQTRVITTRQRPRQVTIHWIVGSIAFTLCLFSGLAVASAFMKQVSFETMGVLVQPVSP